MVFIIRTHQLSFESVDSIADHQSVLLAYSEYRTSILLLSIPINGSSQIKLIT
jgi:hypothetical protein